MSKNKSDQTLNSMERRISTDLFYFVAYLIVLVE